MELYKFKIDKILFNINYITKKKKKSGLSILPIEKEIKMEFKHKNISMY